MRMDFTVMGDGVNVAARFCSKAKGREIVIGQDTYDAVCDIAEGKSIGSLDLKGKTEGVPALQVHAIK